MLKDNSSKLHQLDLLVYIFRDALETLTDFCKAWPLSAEGIF